MPTNELASLMDKACAVRLTVEFRSGTPTVRSHDVAEPRTPDRTASLASHDHSCVALAQIQRLAGCGRGGTPEEPVSQI